MICGVCGFALSRSPHPALTALCAVGIAMCFPIRSTNVESGRLDTGSAGAVRSSFAVSNLLLLRGGRRAGAGAFHPVFDLTRAVVVFCNSLTVNSLKPTPRVGRISRRPWYVPARAGLLFSVIESESHSVRCCVVGCWDVGMVIGQKQGRLRRAIQIFGRTGKSSEIDPSGCGCG